VRVGRWEEKTQTYVKMQPHEANAISGLARTILDSTKFTEEMSLKVSDRSSQERMQQAEQQLAELEEYFVTQHQQRPQGTGKGQLQ
jgi:predicted mannosyl-3-phosphoglycerate phosphatase (HAD superfamily)